MLWGELLTFGQLLAGFVHNIERAQKGCIQSYLITSACLQLHAMLRQAFEGKPALFTEAYTKGLCTILAYT